MPRVLRVEAVPLDQLWSDAHLATVARHPIALPLHGPEVRAAPPGGRTLVRFGRWLEPVLGGRSNERLGP